MKKKQYRKNFFLIFFNKKKLITSYSEFMVVTSNDNANINNL